MKTYHIKAAHIKKYINTMNSVFQPQSDMEKQVILLTNSDRLKKMNI